MAVSSKRGDWRRLYSGRSAESFSDREKLSSGDEEPSSVDKSPSSVDKSSSSVDKSSSSVDKPSSRLVWMPAGWEAPANVRAWVTSRRGGISEPPFSGFNLGTHVGDTADAVMANRRLLRDQLP